MKLIERLLLVAPAAHYVIHQSSSYAYEIQCISNNIKFVATMIIFAIIIFWIIKDF